MNRIRQLREENNLIQKDLADFLGVSIPTINYYEQEKRNIDVDTIKKLADYFGVSVDYLICKTDIRNPKTLSLSDEDVKFIKSIKKLTETEKKIIRDTMEAFLDKEEKNEKKEN